MKNILCTIYSIHGGGAERTMQYLLSRLDRGTYRVHLCLFHRTENDRAVVPADVTIHYLDTRLRPATFFIALKLIALAARLRPHRLVSFMWKTNLTAIFAGLLTGTGVLVCEQVSVPDDIGGTRLWPLWKTLIASLYPKADRIVAVSGAVKRGMIEHFSLKPGRIEVIPNSVDLERVDRLSREYVPPETGYVVSCGRLEYQKNYGSLIDAMATLKGASASLVIAGKGSEKAALAERAKAAGVPLVLAGFLENPYPWISRAAVFAFTSRYEGLPVVLLEAMALRVPVVAMECPGIDAELIEDGVTGILVPQGDIPAMGAAISRLLNDETLRRTMAENAYLKAREIFSTDAMVTHYERLLKGERA